MSSLKSAMNRVRQRSKLPSGDKIITIPCVKCQTKIWCWNDDIMLTDRYHYRVLCTCCKQVERAENAAIFGNRLTK